MTLVYNIGLVALAIGTVLFPPYYHASTKGHWRRSMMGRHVMGYSSAAASLALAAVVRVFFPDVPGSEGFRTFAIWLAVAFVWQRLIIAVRVQHAPDDERTRESERID